MVSSVVTAWQFPLTGKQKGQSFTLKGMLCVCGMQTAWALRHRGQMLHSAAAHLQHLNWVQFSSTSQMGTPGNAANTFDFPHTDALCDVEHF